MPTAPTAPSYVTRRLNGVVRSETNQPIADATVTIWNDDDSRSVVFTNASGFYETSVEINQNYAISCPSVEVSKPGYDTTQNCAWCPDFQDTTADFYLFQRARVAAGADVRLILAFNGPLCGFELEYGCRLVEVVAPSAGTLTVDLQTDEPSSVVSFGPVTGAMPTPSTHLSRTVAAGTLGIQVILVSAAGLSGPHAFTMRTAFTQ